MINNEKREITSFPFSGLLKLEIPQLADELIVIIEKHDPELLKFKEMNDLLLAVKPKIDGMTVQHGGHQITPKLKRLRAKLNLEVRTIKLKLDLVIKTDPTGENSDVLFLKTEITRFLDKFTQSRNKEIMHRKLIQFNNEVNMNPELQTAMDFHNFMMNLDDMNSTLNQISEYTRERLSSISQRPKGITPELTKKVIKAMQNVIQEINLQQLKNPTLDYSELINDVNGLLGYFKYLMNIRKAMNERKALGLPPIEIDGATVTPSMFRASADGNFAPGAVKMIGDELNVDINKSLNQKKTVASSGKLPQLPSVNNEAD